MLCFSLVCGLCSVCHGSFALSFGVIVRLYSVIAVILGTLSIYALLFITDYLRLEFVKQKKKKKKKKKKRQQNLI